MGVLNKDLCRIFLFCQVDHGFKVPRVSSLRGKLVLIYRRSLEEAGQPGHSRPQACQFRTVVIVNL